MQYRDYGSMLNSEGIDRHRSRQYGWKTIIVVPLMVILHSGQGAIYEPGQNTDDGSVEFSEYDLARVPDRLNSETRFKNKIEEDIWRLKNKK